MRKHIIALAHQPKKVTILSLIIAIIIGFWGYRTINTKPTAVFTQNESDQSISSENISSSPKNLTLAFLNNGRIKSVLVKVGDRVKNGQVLATLDAENAIGALAQSKAVYTTAKANYQKIVSGATGVNIDVAKAAVHTAQTNLDGVTKQQNLLVANAYQNFLNSSISASYPFASNASAPLPTISGTYVLGNEGDIKISVYQGGDGYNFSSSGLVNSSGAVSTATPQPIGESGLFIQFPVNYSYQGDFIISIPNKKASNYLSNYNAYQLALQAKSQAVANAQASLDQANASLNALVALARPEDVMIAQAQVDNAYGAMQIAQATYDNTIIKAPSDGTITAVHISAGQIAGSGVPAIEFSSN